MKKKCSFLFIIIFVVSIFKFTPGVEAANYEIDFETYSAAIELVNLDSDTIVYQKNADARREPASTTKIMTYIIVAEHISDLENTRITVRKEVIDRLLGTGSSMSNIQEGDVLTAFQLLNCMMVPSGNDAAEVLADYVGNGSEATFVEMMNQKAQELGCTNTHFANSHGLHDENHYTTAHDLAIITKYAMTLPYFTDITSQVTYTYSPVDGPNKDEKRTHTTTNKMININDPDGYYYKYARGIKTGHTNEAGYCLVSRAVYNGYSYLCVALGSPSVDANGDKVALRGEMKDSYNLYKWAFTNLESKKILSKETAVDEVKLNYAWNKDTLLVMPKEDYSTILPQDISASSVIIKTDLPESIDAPVKKGDILGTATLSYAGQDLTTVDLVASESVERSELLHTTDTLKSILSSPWFLVIAIIIVLLVIIYIILAVMYNRKKKNLRKVKKYRKM